MIVNVDIQPALGQGAGVGRYVRDLARHLAPLRGGDDLRLFGFDFRRRNLHAGPEAPGASFRLIRWLPGRAAHTAWRALKAPPYDWLAGPADVYHFPNFLRPPLSRGRRSVVTIHDASFLRHPEAAEPKNLRNLTARIGETVVRADAILTLSRHAAGELEELLRLPPGKVVPIPLAVSPGLARPTPDAVAAARRRWSLERPYILMVSTIEPRKNMRFLAEAFERMTDFDGDLVVVGAAGWLCGPIFERWRQSPRADRIRHLADVDDVSLPALYAGAELFVFPSLYEGFGLPPLESMACGTPVLSSRGGSLPEILGDAAEYVEAFDAGAWAAAAGRLLRDGARRAELVRRGRERAASYSWEETARRTWEVYRRVGGCA